MGTRFYETLPSDFELFDLDLDPNETTNVAGENPQIMELMVQKFEVLVKNHKIRILSSKSLSHVLAKVVPKIPFIFYLVSTETEGIIQGLYNPFMLIF